MDSIFAPWRIDWVERETPPAEQEDCVFCALASSNDEREDRIVAKTADAYVLLNNYPYNPGHVMIVPHTHTGELPALSGADLESFVGLTHQAITAIEATMEPDGFNTGCNLGSAAAGGSIGDHVHRHVVPRWAGDTNFMATIGETKVIVEALERTYDTLREGFAALPSAVDTSGEGAVTLDPQANLA